MSCGVGRGDLPWDLCTLPLSIFVSKTMTRATRSSQAHLAGTPDDVEARFYEALQTGDIEQLMACWGEEDDIVCVPPGGPRLVGAVAIRAAFEAMFAQGAIQVRTVEVHRVSALSSAVHSAVEQVHVALPDGVHLAVVLATNVYHKGPEGWRMVAHHASAGTPVPGAMASPHPRPVLH
jgi:ketosteroid isomerase-like protein